jgi:N-acetylglucosaminyldiphosphoundecaprenol N-acetyl-beta-D-mannosaminyltransferase
MESIKIFQSLVNIRTVDDYFLHLKKSFTGPAPTTFFYLNSYSSYLCDTDAGFRKIFNASDYIIPDGTSIVFAIRFLKRIRVEKVTVNHTFLEKMAGYFDNEGISLFLLGSTSEILDLAKARLNRDYPGLVVAGTHHGYAATAEEIDEVVARINSSRPTVLFVGMGMPLSELWIAGNKHRLTVPCIVTVGNLIEIIAGQRRIAPRWMVNSGVEWVFRLFQEPFRLAPRYLKANSRYLLDLVTSVRTGGSR